MRLRTWLAALLLLPVLGRADDSPEDRLRAALRQSVEQMRAAQDQASQLQTQLTQAQNDLTALKAKYDADEAKLAQLAGTAKPDEVKQMKADLAAAQQRNAALQANLSTVQGQAQLQASLAQDRDRALQITTRGLTADVKALETCKDTNKKLINVAEQVLHLYEDHGFLWVLRKSYEPIIGADKVTLQNMVQDYDDKIRDQEYIPPPELAKPHT